MAAKNENVLSEEFLMDLYRTCMSSDYVLGIVAEHIKQEYLPDREFQALHKAICDHWKRHKNTPSYSLILQRISNQKGAKGLLEDIYETGSVLAPEPLVEQIENYIKCVKFQQVYKEIGALYNKAGYDKAAEKLAQYHTWVDSFSLTTSDFVDVIGTFNTRFNENRKKHNTENKVAPITRFYIDDLDAMNNGRELRTQLTCFLAATGVGKSHAARWIGKNACQIGGLNVLHIQLEGSKAEVTDAYSASLVSCSTFRYETGTIRDAEIEKMNAMLAEVSGRLHVKAYPKFNNHVSTLDIRDCIRDYVKMYGIRPDVVIIDSMDLLTDASGKQYNENGERHKRIAVANDLKDLAADENVWMVVTYQSTIEDRQWLNDENNVLTAYNTAEAKGLSRPMTHLITLNQSDNEYQESTMRLFVAKSRFFKKSKPFKIATDYEHECFYDRQRTMNINKAH